MYARINFDDIRVYDAQEDLCKDLWWINGYMMPDGEFRLDVGDAAVALGYGRKGWSKAFELFEKLGSFQLITSPKPAPTISLSCFIALIILEAESLGNKSAALIQSTFTLEKLTSIFQDAFNLKKTIIRPTNDTAKNPERWRHGY